jgi:hypothetical protein
MTVDSQATKATEVQKSSEPNLCDVNSQLCDSDIHTVPLDLDIQTKTQPEKENLMSKVCVPPTLFDVTGIIPSFSKCF